MRLTLKQPTRQQLQTVSNQIDFDEREEYRNGDLNYGFVAGNYFNDIKDPKKINIQFGTNNFNEKQEEETVTMQVNSLEEAKFYIDQIENFYLSSDFEDAEGFNSIDLSEVENLVIGRVWDNWN